MQNSSFDKVIISDTSCLIALAKINKLVILKKMYKEIIITPEVAAEYIHPMPEWIIQRAVKDKNKIIEILNSKLDIGESSAIALAMETKNSTLIVDEDRARNYARKAGLSIIGTLTVIGNACDQGYIDSYEAVCEDLRKTNFRFSKKLQEEVRKNIKSSRSGALR